MANVLTLQTLVDGPRNLVVKVTGVLDTSDLALTTIVNPLATFQAPPQVRLMHLDYSITDQLELQLQWQGTPNSPLMPIAGRGRMSFVDFGGITDNAATPTGAIQLLSTGWASGTQIFSLILEMVKLGAVYPVR
jgi:hypothetical protein